MIRRAAISATLAAALGGCIPQVEPPYREPPPPLPAERSPAEIDIVPEPQQEPTPPPPSDWQSVPPPHQRPVREAPVATLPAPRPAWESRPAAVEARDVPASTYEVQPGDTLSRVADRTGASTDAIARANAVEPPFVVHAGQRLVIPAGRYHLVRSGETGIAIARAYGIPWSRIIEANALEEPFVLRAGQRILIPGTEPGRSSAAERAAAFSLDVDDILTGGEPALADDQAPAKPVTTPSRVLPATAAVTAPPARLSTGFLWPVDGNVVKRFGRGASGERNDGIKIAVPLRTPIKATAAGTVAYVGDAVPALGGLVIVRHGDGWTSIYGHAAKLLVQRGQAVKRGQTIALSGDTGFADRPEVHFELRRGRTPVDPLTKLPSR